jgi:hypothetical protein
MRQLILVVASDWSVQSRSVLTAKLRELLPHLDERAQRLVLGAEARALGHGGIGAVAEAAGVSLAYLSEIERGRKEVSSEILAGICRVLQYGNRLHTQRIEKLQVNFSF